MKTAEASSEAVYQAALMNYLVSMARTVETNVNHALDALISRNESLAGEVFLLEPRVNVMEIIIDDHAVQLLRQGNHSDEDIRLVVATQKITNDLERIGDLAVNIARCVVALTALPGVEAPQELKPMTEAVRAMFSRSLGALIFRNVDLAGEVLRSDDLVDSYRDQLFERLLRQMSDEPSSVNYNMHFILTTRFLERIADHTTNIAEDIIFWVRGQDVRHGRALAQPSQGPGTHTVRSAIASST